jgi:hypothetical protein
MPTEVESSAQPGRLSFIRAPQNFFAGLALVAIAAFAIWATSDLSQGTLRAMGPAMLPRWLAIGVGACGVALAALALFSSGDPLRLSDYAALVTFAVVLSVAALVARFINVTFYGGAQGTNAFFYTVIVLFYGTILLMFILSFAITIRLFGLVVAGPLAMIIGGYATPEVREKEIIIFAAIMTAFCVGLFRYVLNLPIPILIIPGYIHI